MNGSIGVVVKRCDSRLIVRVCTEQGGLLSGRRVKVKAENLLQLSRAQQHQIKLPLLTVQLLQRAQKARTLEAQMLGMREQLELMSAEVKRVNGAHQACIATCESIFEKCPEDYVSHVADLYFYERRNPVVNLVADGEPVECALRKVSTTMRDTVHAQTISVTGIGAEVLSTAGRTALLDHSSMTAQALRGGSDWVLMIYMLD